MRGRTPRAVVATSVPNHKVASGMAQLPCKAILRKAKTRQIRRRAKREARIKLNPSSRWAICSPGCLTKKKTMDYNEMMMRHAPKQCRPTIVDNNKDYEAAKEAVAKELHKKVEDLTEDEEDRALARLGLCPLDFMD